MDVIHRKREKSLGVLELIAIALGGMVGGGIFTILGISVSMIGVYTPIAIILGGIIASFSAYSYIKLGVYYKDEGATYSFFKRTFPNSTFSNGSELIPLQQDKKIVISIINVNFSFIFLLSICLNSVLFL